MTLLCIPPLLLLLLLFLSSQVLEDNTGVRRVVVTPQSHECYPPSYSPAISPTHHLPPYMAHPHFIPNSHTAFYPPVSPGDMPPHQYYQHHLPPMYGEGKAQPESMPMPVPMPEPSHGETVGIAGKCFQSVAFAFAFTLISGPDYIRCKSTAPIQNNSTQGRRCNHGDTGRLHQTLE